MIGNEFQQFLAQPFVGAMLSMLCFLSLLLVGVIVLLVYVRRQKAMKLRTSSTATFSMPDDDMPDLNLLVRAPPVEAAPPPQPLKAAQPVAPAPVPVRTPRKGTFQIKPGDGSASEAVEVLTILRDITDGKLIIQMGDKVYQNVNADADFRDRFNKLVSELTQLTRRSAPQSTSLVSNTEPEEALRAEQVRSTPPVAPRPPKAAPSPLPGGAMPGVLPSFKLDDQPMGQKRGRKLELPPVPEINIASAIETYLQHKLHQTGEYPGRNIHVYPSRDGGVRIEVDGQFFEAVGDVTDVEVRDYLAQTIQEWQEHH
jgi:hypothetical protein